MDIAGNGFMNLKKPQESLRSFDKALSLSPKFLPALEGAAETAYAVRDGRARNCSIVLLRYSLPTNCHAMAAALFAGGKELQRCYRSFHKSRARD